MSAEVQRGRTTAHLPFSAPATATRPGLFTLAGRKESRTSTPPNLLACRGHARKVPSLHAIISIAAYKPGLIVHTGVAA